MTEKIYCSKLFHENGKKSQNFNSTLNIMTWISQYNATKQPLGLDLKTGIKMLEINIKSVMK